MRRYKGGGGSAPTETTVTQTDLPEYVEPYFKRLLQRGEAESIQGYDPYGGQRLAYFSPDVVSPPFSVLTLPFLSYTPL